MTEEQFDMLDHLQDDDLVQKLMLRFNCNNLPNMDVGSLSDPFCVLWKVNSNGQKEKIGMTECIVDSLDPHFVKPILVDYFFE